MPVSEHVLVIDTNGDVRTLYTDLIDLRELGTLDVQRASNVEWCEKGNGWVVQFIDGTYLSSDDNGVAHATYGLGVDVFDSREEALAAEVAYLNARL